MLATLFLLAPHSRHGLSSIFGLVASGTMSDSSRNRSLRELRQTIDAVDDRLLELIRKRMELAARIGSHKHEEGNTAFYVPSREAQIIRRLLKKNRGIIPEAALQGIFREIIGACLSSEQPLTIAYLGPEGTFTHVASRRQFGAMAQYMPCKSLDEVFDEVEAGRVTYGMVPVENAFEGAVTLTLDLLVDSQVSICAEVLLGIHEHLLSRAKRLKDIQQLISHPQPLGQCRRWLQAHLPWAETIEVNSTAQAAELALKEPRLAAIAPEEVAMRLELPILRRNIEDYHGNTTRFLVIGQHDSPPSGEDKTALVMSVKDRPGALHDLLEPFHKRGIGLTRIESRPSKKRLWEYVFFVDLQGHREDADVAAALGDIRALPDSFLKVLGSFPVASRL